MSISGIKQILLFILLVFLQVGLFNKVHLFGYATPLAYIYFIIKLPGDMNRNMVLLLSALIGLTVDIFEYTLGINMLACVLIGFLRFYLLKLFAPRDIFESYTPSFNTFGQALFLRYAGVMTFAFTMILFITEALSLFDPWTLFCRIVGSFLLTFLLIFAFENMNNAGLSRR
ncbi:MAG: rod shape-determining protein MreD [Candidatus Symbiothrix sp.]|jgi:rod shape-determining protein MreD|nr:rod shape-determining protein MreD [Candidatus Symbiothrix sp.]